jgi:hypothetical protein
MGRWAILNGFLILIALLLTLEIARTWGRSLPPVEVGARSADPPPKGDGNGDAKGAGARHDRGKRGPAEKAVVQPTTLIATIIDRDLFDPSRQKATEEVKPPPPKEVGPPPNLTVVGIRILGAKDSEAFITDASQANQQRRLRVGDQVGGYTLKTITPSRVTLASATGDTVTLSLAVDKSGGQGAPRPGAPPRPGQPATANAGSPAAGIQPQAPGQPRGPRPGIPPGRPGAPGVPGAPGTPPAAGAPSPAAGVMPNFGPAQGGAGAPAPPTAAPSAPSIPAAVREKLEQLKGN